MATDNTKYLDLDAVLPDVELVVKLGGKDHKLVPVSVSDFVKNTKMIQELAAASNDEESNLKIIFDMLLAAFPTMTLDMLKKLTLPQLEKLRDFAWKNNGSAAVTNAAEADAKANPQPAGQ